MMMEMMLTMCTEIRLLRDEKMHQNAYEMMSKIYHHTHNYFNGIIFNAHFLFTDVILTMCKVHFFIINSSYLRNGFI